VFELWLKKFPFVYYDNKYAIPTPIRAASPPSDIPITINTISLDIFTELLIVFFPIFNLLSYTSGITRLETMLVVYMIC